jgi:guanine deaminase
MTDRRTALVGGLVLIGNARFAKATLVVEAGRIAAILEGDAAAPEDADRIDASDRLVIPGLVNGHTHSHGALARGAVADGEFLETFLAGLAASNGARIEDDLRLCAALGAAEMIRKGCTACYDMCVELPAPSVDGLHAIAETYHRSGMRAVVAPLIADRTLYQAIPGLLDSFPEPLRSRLAAIAMPPWEETLATCAEAARRWPFPRDKVKPGIGPTIPLHCSDPFLTACARTAADLDLPMQTHLAETRMQQVAADGRYGERLTARLDRLGALSPRFSGAHAVWLDEAEMGLLAAHGCGVSHNPLSNLRLGSGVANVPGLKAAGVTVGVGTDATNTSDAQNMFEATRLAATLSRIHAHPDDWILAGDAFRMATEGSAKLMGLDRVGRIEEGWAADLVFLDRHYCHYQPLRTPLEQIVLSENGAAVREVMIDGAFVFRDDTVLTLDEPALAKAAAAAAERLDAVSEEARQTAQAASALIRTFCIGACAEAARKPEVPA